MNTLKWIGYAIVSIIGLFIVVSVLGLLAAIGATLGTVVVGAFIVFFCAALLNDYFTQHHK